MPSLVREGCHRINVPFGPKHYWSEKWDATFAALEDAALDDDTYDRWPDHGSAPQAQPVPLADYRGLMGWTPAEPLRNSTRTIVERFTHAKGSK